MRLWHPDLKGVTLDRALSALGDPVRRGMVRTLPDGMEHLRGDFGLGLAPSTLSCHARSLREAGIINSRDEGARHFMSLRPEFEERFPGLLAIILTQPDDPELALSGR